DERKWREWIMFGVGLTAVFTILAIILSLAAIAQSSDSAASPTPAPSVKPSSAAGSAVVATSPAPTLAEAKGIAYERFRPVDPTCRAVPAGAGKKSTVPVIQHVVQSRPISRPCRPGPTR